MPSVGGAVFCARRARRMRYGSRALRASPTSISPARRDAAMTLFAILLACNLALGVIFSLIAASVERA